jgi:bacterioferritin-associated ferredoxin
MALEIQPDDLVEEVVEQHPESISYLQQKGLKCIQCGEPVWGTMKEMIEEKNMNAEDVLQELNRFLRGI